MDFKTDPYDIVWQALIEDTVEMNAFDKLYLQGLRLQMEVDQEAANAAVLRLTSFKKKMFNRALKKKL